NSLPCPFLRRLKTPSIPEPAFFIHLLSNARQRRLNRKWNEDLSIEFLRLCPILRRDRIIPQAIEILPFLAHKLRARIFRQRILWGHILCPAGFERPGRRLPIILGREDLAHSKAKQKKNSCHKRLIRYSPNPQKKC